MVVLLLAGLALAAPITKPERPVHAQTDFTAYTLEPGEVRIGLTTAAVGLMPRVHVGTSPVLDAMQVLNGHLKWDFLRLGPLDLAMGGALYWAPGQDDFHGHLVTVSGALSLQVARPWSIHATGRWGWGQAEGIPSLDGVAGLVGLFTDSDPDTWELDGIEAPTGTGRALMIEVATDLRITRKDSLVLRAGWMASASGKADLGEDLAGMLGVDRQQSWEAAPPIHQGYTVSLSYQVTFRNLQMRVGAGHSAVPWVWAAQAFDLSWRGGGPTRREERRLRKG